MQKYILISLGIFSLGPCNTYALEREKLKDPTDPLKKPVAVHFKNYTAKKLLIQYRAPGGVREEELPPNCSVDTRFALLSLLKKKEPDSPIVGTYEGVFHIIQKRWRGTKTWGQLTIDENLFASPYNQQTMQSIHALAFLHVDIKRAHSEKHFSPTESIQYTVSLEDPDFICSGVFIE